MKRSYISFGVFLALIGLAVGCTSQPALPPTPTRTPQPLSTATVLPMPTNSETGLTEGAVQPETSTPALLATTEQAAIETPVPTSTELPEVQVVPTRNPALPSDHYWLIRPIPRGFQDYLDRTYAYGLTSGGAYRPHTGGDFFNASGTPVVAAANGVVIYAGTDVDVLFGPQPDFYGQVIVVQLTDFAYSGRPVYILYGHLSEIHVATGQTVVTGGTIGLVGGTGVANGGSHLHFEVRLDDPYAYTTSTRNIDLWITPYGGYGTLAGRIVDSSGKPMKNVAITIRGDDAVRYTYTYAGDENIPDDEWGENFTYGDLPAGWYTVTTRSETKTYRESVYIRQGETTWLELRFDS